MQAERTGRESAIEKVRKMLALASDAGATEPERMLAAERAQAFMLRYNIETLELEQQLTGERQEFVEDRDALIEGQSNFWKGDLLYAIGLGVGDVEGFYLPITRTKRRQVLIGRPDAIAFVRELAAYLTPFLEIECEAALIAAKAAAAGERIACDECDEDGEVYVPDRSSGFSGRYVACPDCGGKRYTVDSVNTRRFRSSFYDAALARIRNRLAKQRLKLEQDLADAEGTGAGSGMALVRIERDALKQHMKDHHSDLRSSSSTRGGDYRGHVAGSVAGERADLAPGSKIRGGQRQIGSGS